MLYLIWAAVVVAALVLYFRKTYSVFSKHGIKHDTPLPVAGNMLSVLLRREHMVDNILSLYQKYPEEKFVGRYEFLFPVVMIRDIELVKKITLKDFEHFLDHRAVFNAEVEPLFGRNLVSLTGQEWKDMRSTLSPAFTSSKIRLMVPFILEVGEQMTKALKAKIEASGDAHIDVDSKDLTTRYANDVIATCAFGLKVDSLTDEKNQFYAMGKAATTFTVAQLFKMIGYSSIPKLMKALKVSLFSNETKHFFRELVLSTMRDRDARHIIRPDMIHLLMEAKKGKLSHDDKSSKDLDAGFATVEESVIGKKSINREWSDDDLVAQAVLFFLAGFDTVSTTMIFLLHELALNPDVQDKLVQEIRDNNAKNGGKFDYNSIQNMVYLDMVVSEVLRLWPPGIALDRACVKDYNLGKPNPASKEDFILRKGGAVSIPLWAIHRDPDYFPNPNKFDPERFSEENKQNIKPFTYMPFGVGPRNCIGSRFALCEVKVMAYQLLQHFELSPSEKTCVPAVLAPESLSLLLKGGNWVRLKVRQ